MRLIETFIIIIVLLILLLYMHYRTEHSNCHQNKQTNKTKVLLIVYITLTLTRQNENNLLPFVLPMSDEWRRSSITTRQLALVRRRNDLKIISMREENKKMKNQNHIEIKSTIQSPLIINTNETRRTITYQKPKHRQMEISIYKYYK